jgi:hypothetical protein
MANSTSVDVPMCGLGALTALYRKDLMSRRFA